MTEEKKKTEAGSELPPKIPMTASRVVTISREALREQIGEGVALTEEVSVTELLSAGRSVYLDLVKADIDLQARLVDAVTAMNDSSDRWMLNVVKVSLSRVREGALYNEGSRERNWKDAVRHFCRLLAKRVHERRHFHILLKYAKTDDLLFTKFQEEVASALRAEGSILREELARNTKTAVNQVETPQAEQKGTASLQEEIANALRAKGSVLREELARLPRNAKTAVDHIEAPQSEQKGTASVAEAVEQFAASATPEEIGSFVKQIRKSAKLSQIQLLARMPDEKRVSPSTLSEIERGMRLPNVATLTAIAEAAGGRLRVEFQKLPEI